MSIKLFCDQCQSQIDLGGDRYSLSSNYLSLDFDKRECITDWFAANPEAPEQQPQEPDPEPDPEPTPDPDLTPDPDPAPAATLDPTTEDEAPAGQPDAQGLVYRDASSGEYVTAEYAAEHPDTTVSEQQ